MRLMPFLRTKIFFFLDWDGYVRRHFDDRLNETRACNGSCERELHVLRRRLVSFAKLRGCDANVMLQSNATLLHRTRVDVSSPSIHQLGILAHWSLIQRSYKPFDPPSSHFICSSTNVTALFTIMTVFHGTVQNIPSLSHGNPPMSLAFPPHPLNPLESRSHV
ncbi:hypothetical protein BU24DRAFT_235982 [Aaosphaeria arxii CBS 175.79]|uniref:Uncharacterized protein n=1 Tax=Aaosphaeria arxii CBS 175.79 TaxID=1450172 RepID=A0A6A5XKF2_9PLEO|nr:uncharacterized protein BU24DRAFT_235982 [Aaosphaeria arxii CBS 175.79]KAF2013359.1 hypothetical protein BU24DRAFT_235982 [Aaosphaeria arxii CBS 175.79]